jgi:hypothetical protein
LTVSLKLPTGIVPGDTEVTDGIGFSRVTGAVADNERLAELMAVTFTEFGLGRVAGAV